MNFKAIWLSSYFLGKFGLLGKDQNTVSSLLYFQVGKRRQKHLSNSKDGAPPPKAGGGSCKDMEEMRGSVLTPVGFSYPVRWSEQERKKNKQLIPALLELSVLPNIYVCDFCVVECEPSLLFIGSSHLWSPLFFMKFPFKRTSLN